MLPATLVSPESYDLDIEIEFEGSKVMEATAEALKNCLLDGTQDQDQDQI